MRVEPSAEALKITSACGIEDPEVEETGAHLLTETNNPERPIPRLLGSELGGHRVVHATAVGELRIEFRERVLQSR